MREDIAVLHKNVRYETTVFFFGGINRGVSDFFMD